MVLPDGIYDKSIFTFRLHRLERGEKGKRRKGRATESSIQSREKTHNWIGETFEIMVLESRNLRRIPGANAAPLRASKDRNNCTIERGGRRWSEGKEEGRIEICMSVKSRSAMKAFTKRGSLCQTVHTDSREADKVRQIRRRIESTVCPLFTMCLGWRCGCK